MRRKRRLIVPASRPPITEVERDALRRMGALVKAVERGELDREEAIRQVSEIVDEIDRLGL